jgi:hypothetical protein
MARNGYYREYETDFQQFQNDFKLPAAGYLDEYDEKVFKMME